MADVSTIVIKGETSGVRQATADLDKFEQATKDVTAATDKLGQEASETAGRYVDANGRMRDANGQFVKSSETVTGAQQRQQQATQSSARATKAFGEAKSQASIAAQNYASRLGPIGAILSSLGPAGIAAGAGIAVTTGALIEAAREAVRFEAALAGVSKTTDIAGPALDRVGDRLRQMSVDLGETSQGLLETAQSAGQLGVSGADNILLFTETVTKLGTASDLSGEQAAVALARLQSVTGESADSVDTLASVIVSLGNNFAATESEIVSSAQRVAQASARFGVSAAEATAFGAALRQLGVEAESGGTQIGLAFQAISDAVNQGGEALAALEDITNRSGKSLRSAFNEDSVTAVLNVVEAIGALPAEEQAAALESLGLNGVRAVQVIATLGANADVLKRALDAANAETENATALNTEFARKSDTAAFQLARLDAAIDSLQITIGLLFLPAVTNAAEGLAELTKSTEDFIKNGPESLENPILRNVAAFVKFNATGGLLGAAVRKIRSEMNSSFNVVGLYGTKIGQVADEAERAPRILTTLDRTAADAAETFLATGDATEMVNLTLKRLSSIEGPDATYALDNIADATDEVERASLSLLTPLQEQRMLHRALKEDGVAGYERVAEAIEINTALQTRINELMESGIETMAEAALIASEEIALSRQNNEELERRNQLQEEGQSLLERANEQRIASISYQLQQSATEEQLNVLRTQGIEAYERLVAEQERARQVQELALEISKEQGIEMADAIVLAENQVATQEQLTEEYNRQKSVFNQNITLMDMLKGAAEEAGRAIQRSLADAFRNVFDGNIKGFRDFFDSVVDIAKNAAAQIAAQFAFQNIVSFARRQGGVSLGSVLSSGATAAGGGGGGGGGAGALASAAGLFGSGGMGTGLSGAGLGSGFMGVGGLFAPGGAFGAGGGGLAQVFGLGSQVGIPGAPGSGFVTSGLGTAVNMAGVGALGAGAGVVLADLLGNQSATGGAIGGAAGAVGGMKFGAQLGMVGGPVGAAIGALIGGAIGSFAGGKEDKGSFALQTGGSGFTGGITAQSAFGNLGLGRGTADIGGDLAQTLLGAVAQADQLVASALTEQQIADVRTALQGTGQIVRTGRGNKYFEQAFGKAIADRFLRIFQALGIAAPSGLSGLARNDGTAGSATAGDVLGLALPALSQGLGLDNQASSSIVDQLSGASGPSADLLGNIGTELVVGNQIQESNGRTLREIRNAIDSLTDEVRRGGSGALA